MFLGMGLSIDAACPYKRIRALNRFFAHLPCIILLAAIPGDEHLALLICKVLFDMWMKSNISIFSHNHSSKTMQKLCLTTKFPHQEIRWNYGILRMNAAHANKLKSLIKKNNVFLMQGNKFSLKAILKNVFITYSYQI